MLWHKTQGAGGLVGGAAGGWDLSNATYNGENFSISSFEGIPTGLSFSSDGSNVYISGNAGDNIEQLSLNTAWDVSSADITSLQSRNISFQDGNPRDLFFKPDGTKMYMVGNGGDNVYEYDLSTAWDVTTASYVQAKGVSGAAPQGLFFKPDGTKMYVVGDRQKEYDLSTAWDISTATVTQDINVNVVDLGIQAIYFRSDGLKAYTIVRDNDTAREYDLSVAWDGSTASFLQDFDISSQIIEPTGLFFKPDGTKMFIVGRNSDSIFAYDL
jgi:DNA-binding beta-propeller fold protein YncE